MLFMLNNFSKLTIRKLIFQPCRYSSLAPFNVEHLRKRTVLRLSGPDTSNYIQAMITNDVKNVEKTPILYSLLLNTNGRVLYDTLLYNTSANEYLVEYDATGKEYLDRHLLMYRLRKDVKIEPLNSMDVWVMYKNVDEYFNEADCQSLLNHLKQIPLVVSAESDPRNKLLGIRVLTKKGINLTELLKESGFDVGNNEPYNILRYKLGIGEGVLDHPPGNCLPFETNVDLLNGVSFSKGCYIGQEMTAKSNYVLTIRKRLMPVTLDKMDSYPIFPPECDIFNEKNKKLGRLRSHIGQFGLALLKYEDCFNSSFLKLKDHDIKLKTFKPKWWPENIRSDSNEYVLDN